MRIGVYGGTFNPPHKGHVTAGQAAIEQLQLDKLFVIPDKLPPHKILPEGSAEAVQRYEMAQLLCAELGDCAEALAIELQREGLSYTVDTLCQLHAQYPNDTLYLLMGSDMFLSLHTWHAPQSICRYAHLAPFSRVKAPEQADFAAQAARLHTAYHANTTVVVNPHVLELSSTDVRAALREGRGEELIPEAVYGYIVREHLYGTNVDLQTLSPDRLRPIAMSYLKPKRMPHVRGTEQEAVRLARHYGVNEQEARVAALLHDCTKKLDMDAQLGLCRAFGLELDELEQHALKLLHSRTGAEIARRVYGVSDAVYDAIRYHTTGRAGMSALEKIIYLADYIEPSRDFDGVEQLRKVVYEDLDKGMLLGMLMTIQEMKDMGNPVHHNTLDAKDDFIKKGITL